MWYILKQYPLDKDILLLPDTRRSDLQLFEKRRGDTLATYGSCLDPIYDPVGTLSCKWNHSQEGSIMVVLALRGSLCSLRV